MYQILTVVVFLVSTTMLGYTQALIKNGSFKNNFNYWYFGDTKFISHSFIDKGEYNLLKASIHKRPVNLWDVQLVQSINGNIQQEDKLFLQFKLRNPDFPVVLHHQINGEPYTKINTIEIPVSNESKSYRIVYDGFLKNWTNEELALVFFFGQDTGAFEIGNISFDKLDASDSIDNLNPTHVYDPFWGTQKPGNQWKSSAQTRIDTLRKDTIQIKVFDVDGNPLSNHPVEIHQLKQDFHFGSAIQAKLFSGGHSNAEYQDKVNELFNMVTFENALKWRQYKWLNQYAADALAWAAANKIPVRGHCLFWPSYKYCPDWLSELSPDAMRDSITNHVKEYVSRYKGSVVHWDVINEAVTNTEIWQKLGIEVLVDCFKTAHQIDTAVTLFYNDYGMISQKQQKKQDVKSLVEKLINMGAPIEAIGLQAHLKLGDLVTPENIIRDLDTMATLGLPIYITELDIDVGDYAEFHGNYLADVLTTFYSHPAVEGIIQWGFWESAHWKPNTSLYTSDWQQRPAGNTYTNLVLDQWKTDTVLTSDINGNLTLTGFLGKYHVKAIYERGGSFYLGSTEFQLQKNNTDTVNLILDQLTSIDRNDHPYYRNGLVYPNPFSNATTLRVKHNEIENIDIYSMNGKKITEMVYKPDKFTIDMNGYPNGIYILKIVSETNKHQIFKLIKHEEVNN